VARVKYERLWVTEGSRLQIDLLDEGPCPELCQWTIVPLERVLWIPTYEYFRFQSRSNGRSHHEAAEYTIRRCRPL